MTISNNDPNGDTFGVFLSAPMDTSPRVVEARTIRDLRDLRQYYEACLAALAGADEGAIRLATPIDMRLIETVRPDGSSVFDLHVAKW